jgi:hypothetical protein
LTPDFITGNRAAVGPISSKSPRTIRFEKKSMVGDYDFKMLYVVGDLLKFCKIAIKLSIATLQKSKTHVPQGL